MTIETFKAQYQAQQARVARIDRMLYARANAYADKARIGTYRNVWQNAMNARDEGRPWAEVDYSALRAALWVDEQRGRAERLLSAWWARVAPRVYGR